jgi:SAM-dependent methyltransferase
VSRPEFDHYADSYEELLKDPIRDRFGKGSRFFHERKRDLIRAFCRRHDLPTRSMRYLDVGCGKGELVTLLRNDFGSVAGCDPSARMLGAAEGIDIRVQRELGSIPYENDEFDFVTCVCVYHHVPPPARLALTREINRVVRPGGVFVIIEHNPYNPATRLIVSRTPVDADAVLLTQRESSALMKVAGFCHQESQYFLYFPEFLYRRVGDAAESWLRDVPLGGQYAVFATKGEASSR